MNGQLHPVTVLGEPLAAGYDLVLAHEHLLIDIRCWLDADARERDPELEGAQVGPETLAAVRANPFACLDNLVLDDEELLLGELAALRGAGMAQALLGVPLYVHVDPWASQAHEALDVLEAAGADLTRVVVCHLDVSVGGGDHGDHSGRLALHKSLLERGCLVAFDIWGDEYAYGERGMPTDEQRLAATLELIAAGYGDRLVHAHDVCTKTQLRRFGGHGFTRLSAWLRPRLEQAGLPEGEVRRQLAGNALRLLLPAS